MDCNTCQLTLEKELAGVESDVNVSAAREHLSRCPDCQRYVACQTASATVDIELNPCNVSAEEIRRSATTLARRSFAWSCVKSGLHLSLTACLVVLALDNPVFWALVAWAVVRFAGRLRENREDIQKAMQLRGDIDLLAWIERETIRRRMSRLFNAVGYFVLGVVLLIVLPFATDRWLTFGFAMFLWVIGLWNALSFMSRPDRVEVASWN